MPKFRKQKQNDPPPFGLFLLFHDESTKRKTTIRTGCQKVKRQKKEKTR